MSGFTVSNGKIFDPNGNEYVAAGINVGPEDMGSVSDILSSFPGINFVRLAIGPYQDPSSCQDFVNAMTSQGVVVEIEDHTSSDGQNRGGSTGEIFSGDQLSQEQSWYSTLASMFKDTPYVWFGTNNEPSEINPATGQNDPAALSDWQKQTYDTIRSAGSNSPVMLEGTAWGADQV